MKDYEQELFDAVTKLHDNLQYCMVSHHTTGTLHKCYAFVNSIDINTEHWYYDGYCGIEFTIGNLNIFLSEDSFAVWDKDKPNDDPVFPHVTDLNLDIIDKNSYFQCSIIENLRGIRWELFPMMKKIRSTFFDEWVTREILEDGFKFI